MKAAVADTCRAAAAQLRTTGGQLLASATESGTALTADVLRSQLQLSVPPLLLDASTKVCRTSQQGSARVMHSEQARLERRCYSCSRTGCRAQPPHPCIAFLVILTAASRSLLLLLALACALAFSGCSRAPITALRARVCCCMRITVDWWRGRAGYGGCVQHGQQRSGGGCSAGPEGAGAPGVDARRGGDSRRHGSRRRCLCLRPRLPGAGAWLPWQAGLPYAAHLDPHCLHGWPERSSSGLGTAPVLGTLYILPGNWS